MKKIYSIVALALVAASCSSLMEKDINPVNPAVVQFTSNIGAFTTKATADGFETGDQVGIIAMDPINVDNVLYTFSGNTLTSSTPIHWLENQQEGTYFFAYYPYDEEMSIYTDYKYELKVATDQRSHEAYSRSDFLVAQTRAMPGEKVDLEFEHFMSRVDISLPESLVSDVASVALSGVYTSMVDGEPFNEAAVTAAELTDASGEKFYSAIIVPQETAPSLVITKTDGSVLSYPVGKIVNFEYGKRYYAQLSIKDDGSLEAEFVFRIFDWLQGDWVWFEDYVPQPDPVTVGSWSVIGDFPASQGWSVDIPMHKCYGETQDGWYALIYAEEGNQFKLRADGSWDVNMGASTEGRLGGHSVYQDGPNMVFPEAGFYELYFYPEDDYYFYYQYIEAGNSWGITGTVENLGWEQDHFADGLAVNAGGYPLLVYNIAYNDGEEFKFRFQRIWNWDYGYSANWGDNTIAPIGEHTALLEGGPNILLPQSGSYVLTFDLYGKDLYVEYTGENGGNGEQPVTTGAWSVIGQIQGHNWDYDIPMYQCYDNGGYYALIYYREGESFKLRKDADWADNRGITGGGGVGSYGAVAGGDNIVLPGEGIYEVFYYPNEEYIYIAEYGNNDTWGITGTLEAMEWNADHMSNQATVNDNLCPVIVFNDVVYNQGEEFKIRFQHQWFFEYGGYGDVLVPGYTYATQAAGANMTIGESGTYTVYFNLYDQTVMVEQSSGENPQLPAISIPEIVELVKGGTSSSAVSFEGIIDYTLVTYVNGSYAYLQDNSGSILLYQKEHGLNTGDIFKGHIYGSGYSYNGLPEIISIGDQYTLEGNSGSVNPDNVTLERVYDYYDFFTSRLIRLEGVTVTASSGRNATIVQDGMQIALYAQDRSLTLPAVNSVGNLTAIVGIYGETKQLLIWEDGWFEKTGEVETPEDNSVWEKKALSNLSSGDEIVLVSVKDGAVYAMSNSGGTSSAPIAVQVTPENDTLTGPSADICWIVDVTDDGFVFYKDQSSWLYSTSANNGNRVGTNENKFYTLCDEGYLFNVATSRYIGVYNNQDWRCYTSINNNIKDQEFYAFVKVSE